MKGGHVTRFHRSLLAIAMVASGVALGGLADPAGAHEYPRDQNEARHNSTLNAMTPLRLCIDLRDASCAGYKNLGSGTTVLMRCWWDGQNSAGATTRFFWVDTVGNNNGQGFVTANLVSSQWSAAPWCGNDAKIKAIQWGGRKFKDDYRSGWCLTYARETYWNGAGIERGAHTSARTYWVNYPNVWSNSGKPVALGSKVATRTNYFPPLGAFAFWDNAPDGHVALSIGDGIVLSTARPGAGETRVHVYRVNAATSGYAGWVQF